MITFEATKEIRDDHPAFPGHFPGDPILPGAVLAELIVESALEAGWKVVAIESLKFGKPVKTGGLLRVFLRRSGPLAQFECSMGGAVVASGKVRLGE